VHERIRDTLLGAWGRFVTSRPALTLCVCLSVAAAALLLTFLRLEFKPDRSDLVDQDLAWNRRYADYKARFPRWDDVTVCIEGEPGDERVDRLARDIGRGLLRHERVLAADAGFDISETGPRLLAAAPQAMFDEVLRNIAHLRRITAAENANAALAVAMGQLRAENGPGEALDQLEQFLQPYTDALLGRPPDFCFLRPDQPRWLPLMSEIGSGRLRFIQIQFDDTDADIDQDSENVRWLREEIPRLIARSDLPDVKWGVTGIPAIEADETTQSIHDSTLASIIAFVLITVLMLVVFRGVVVPLLAAGSLLIGLSWSFGWLVLSVGHLQLLSVVFSAILLGLGIDFALHLVARLELVQDEHEDLPSAASRVYRGIGPGMLTGAVTTAAAFGVTALTEFKGMAEMGIIAGGGILLCLVAMLCCFPAALAATGRWKRIIRHRPGGEAARFARGALDFVDFHPRGTLLFAALVVLALIVPLLRVRYDPNVLNLQPPKIESVEWEKRLVEDDARTFWSALTKTTAEDAPALVDRFRALPEVSDVGAMGLLLPPDREQRARRLADMRAQSVVATDAPADVQTLSRHLGLVRSGLLRRAPSESESVASRLNALAERIGDALRAAAALKPAEQSRRWSALDEAFRHAADSAAAWIDEALGPEPPGPTDLPPVLRRQWTDAEDWILRIYPAHDEQGRSILHPERLGAFVNAILDVDPNAFGPPVQIYKSSNLIVQEYIKAACYAIAAILVLLLLDFRSLADALCAMTPVALGFLGAFGLMGLVDQPLNFANIIVLPLIFGIGVDAGVHTVHRWRAEPYGRPAGLSGGTGRGISLTMITTMIGFGCMLLAQHRGIRSLGFVMIAGLGVTLLACCFVLPAILRLRTSHWSESRPAS